MSNSSTWYYQQLKSSTNLLNKALSRLREGVKHQRAYNEDFKTLRRSRWRLASPDQTERRSDIWNEHINTIPKRLNNTWRSFDVFRTSSGELSFALTHHQLQTGVQLQIEAHDMLRTEAKASYHSTSLRGDVSDLYRPESGFYVANCVADIHRLWIWCTKNHEEQIFWSQTRKAAAEEHLEVREEEILIPMPNSPTVFTLRCLKAKHIVPSIQSQSLQQSDTPTESASQPAPRSENSMDVDQPTTEAATSAPITQKKRKRLYLDEARLRCRETAAQCDKPVEIGSHLTLPYNVADPFSESDFDVSLSQDLIFLTLKQALLIYLHGSQLDQTRFPLFPTRRLHTQPIQHTIFAPVIAVTHHFRQLLEASRMLDDIAFSVSRDCHLGPLEFHYEPTGLATLSTMHLVFGTLFRSYNINAGTFNVSPLQDIDSPVEFVQHVLQLIADYVIESTQRHVDALCGKGTATIINARCVSFPLGVVHPLRRSSASKHSENTNSNDGSLNGSYIPLHHATFELPVSSTLGLAPVLHVHPHIPGVPSESASWPLEVNIWPSLQGNNFAEKLTSLILSSRQ